MRRLWSVLLASVLAGVLVVPTSAGAASTGDPFGNFERASALAGTLYVVDWRGDAVLVLERAG